MGPAGDRLWRGPKSVAVAADGKQVGLGGNPRGAQSGVVNQAVFHADAVILGLNEKARRRVGRHSYLGGERRRVFALGGQVGRVDQQREIGAATELVGIVHGIVRARVEIRSEEHTSELQS